MFEKGLLAGKRILVTGGGSGLGAAMGRRFVELGAELIICGRRLELLEATAAQMRGDLGGKVAAIGCDIRDGAAVDAMMDTIWREAPLDVLVNNAAATFIAQTEQLSFRAADAVLAPTLHGTMYCTLGAGRRWIDGGHKGVVLSILSTSTITGRAFTVPSAMAKSAVLAMTKSLAVEWGPKGIRTVADAPGATISEAQLQAFGRAVDSLGGRYVTAEDVGMSEARMKVIASQTRYVSGLPVESGAAGGDPGPYTAHGVYLGVKAAAARGLGATDMKGVRVAVQGVGSVGGGLARLLAKDGAVLTLADVDEGRAQALAGELGATAVAAEAEAILAAE